MSFLEKLANGSDEHWSPTDSRYRHKRKHHYPPTSSSSRGSRARVSDPMGMSVSAYAVLSSGPKQRSYYQHQYSMDMNTTQPFCSPVVPHVPIRQRLSQSRRCTSVDVHDEGEAEMLSSPSNGTIGPGPSGQRPRRMSLLQSLRYQNKQLNDSYESSHRASLTGTPQKQLSPPESPTAKTNNTRPSSGDITSSRTSSSHHSASSLAAIKAKTRQILFGKKKKPVSKSLDISEKFLQSFAMEEEEGSPEKYAEINRRSVDRRISPNDDSGRGSQPTTGTASTRATASPRETVAIIERTPPEVKKPNTRSVSCPNLGANLRIYHDLSRAISMHPANNSNESGGNCAPKAKSENYDSVDDELDGYNKTGDKSRYNIDERMLRNSSPISAADHLLERRMYRRAQMVRHRQEHPSRGTQKGSNEGFALQQPQLPKAKRLDEEGAELTNGHEIKPLAIDVTKSTGTLLLSDDNETNDGGSVERVLMTDEDEADGLDDSASTILLDQYLPVKNDKDFLPYRRQDSNRSSSISFIDRSSIDDEDGHSGYHSSSDRVASVAQTDLSLIRISDQLSTYLAGIQLMENGGGLRHRDNEDMNFLAKHFFDYQTYANLPLKPMRVLNNTMPPTRFATSLSTHPPSSPSNKRPVSPIYRPRSNTRSPSPRHKNYLRDEIEKEYPVKKPADCGNSDKRVNSPAIAKRKTANDNPSFIPIEKVDKNPSEVLVILTYATAIEFVTATVKKAKSLPFNNDPFARVMLFDGRKLLEQKQTTITTSAVASRSFKRRASTSSSSCCSGRSNPSSLRSDDVAFSESFLFHVPPQKLDRCHVLFDRDANREVFPVGHCVIGPMALAGGAQHWHEMIRKAGYPICMWHQVTRS